MGWVFRVTLKERKMNTENPVNFSLTEEQKMIQKLARDFARNEIAPVAGQYDKSEEYPWPVIKKAHEGLLTARRQASRRNGHAQRVFAR